MSNLKYLLSAKKEFEYYKQLGEKTFAQLTVEQLFNQMFDFLKLESYS